MRWRSLLCVRTRGYCVGTPCYALAHAAMSWHLLLCVGTRCYALVLAAMRWHSLLRVGTRCQAWALATTCWYSLPCVGTRCHALARTAMRWHSLLYVGTRCYALALTAMREHSRTTLTLGLVQALPHGLQPDRRCYQVWPVTSPRPDPPLPPSLAHHCGQA